MWSTRDRSGDHKMNEFGQFGLLEGVKGTHDLMKGIIGCSKMDKGTGTDEVTMKGRRNCKVRSCGINRGLA